ncbi:unnamed protein product [Notodromas monacha]|uniref:Uncharacterized protein n=1 Tax=Notodromas monacha TaxID=399045 RepID=A0A7R9BKE6_9CRUS|nr:unnamed protein product [Notodromas monacha]CAG0915599.1 unnamed protein product [Notodromas monacha]
MGNVLFAPEIPGSAGTEVYEKPATARLPLRCRYVDHCDELHDNPDEDVTPNTIADITRVRSALSNDYGKGLTASQFVNEIVKSLPRYFHGDPSYMAVLLLKLIQRESGDVEIINFDDLIELADLMESCNTPDDRLAFALYVISSCNPKDILEQ